VGDQNLGYSIVFVDIKAKIRGIHVLEFMGPKCVRMWGIVIVCLSEVKLPKCVPVSIRLGDKTKILGIHNSGDRWTKMWGMRLL